MHDIRPITYITVDTRIHHTGELTPLCLWWGGHPYHISKVISSGPGYCTGGGKGGIAYDCLIHGQRRVLYWDGKTWFMERKT